MKTTLSRQYEAQATSEADPNTAAPATDKIMYGRERQVEDWEKTSRLLFYVEMPAGEEAKTVDVVHWLKDETTGKWVKGGAVSGCAHLTGCQVEFPPWGYNFLQVTATTMTVGKVATIHAKEI